MTLAGRPGQVGPGLGCGAPRGPPSPGAAPAGQAEALPPRGPEAQGLSARPGLGPGADDSSRPDPRGAPAGQTRAG